MAMHPFYSGSALGKLIFSIPSGPASRPEIVAVNTDYQPACMNVHTNTHATASKAHINFPFLHPLTKWLNSLL